MILRDPEVRLRDLAEACGLTERAAGAIIGDLETAGYLTRVRQAAATTTRSRPAPSSVIRLRVRTRSRTFFACWSTSARRRDTGPLPMEGGDSERAPCGQPAHRRGPQPLPPPYQALVPIPGCEGNRP
ncbi:hypothetical protein [Streptomyces sp. NPDC056069]|uniref:hypothetical protein n=1 Tax=Streptomyces sp. NPDC056069 TaxID=3345702 RepID=UPI0035DB91B4